MRRGFILFCEQNTPLPPSQSVGRFLEDRFRPKMFTLFLHARERQIFTPYPTNTVSIFTIFRFFLCILNTRFLFGSTKQKKKKNQKIVLFTNIYVIYVS